MSGKRRKYAPEFRGQAAHLVIETSRPLAQVAVAIGVGEQALGRWVPPPGSPLATGPSEPTTGAAIGTINPVEYVNRLTRTAQAA